MISLIILDSTLGDLLDLKGVMSIVLFWWAKTKFVVVVVVQADDCIFWYRYIWGWNTSSTKTAKHTGIRRPFNTLYIV